MSWIPAFDFACVCTFSISLIILMHKKKCISVLECVHKRRSGLYYNVIMVPIWYNRRGIRLSLCFLPCSPSWDTWRSSSVPCTPASSAPASSSTHPRTGGTLLRATCSVRWCPPWWSCSNCCSSCPAWTAESPASDGAGRATARKKKTRNRSSRKSSAATEISMINVARQIRSGKDSVAL